MADAVELGAGSPHRADGPGAYAVVRGDEPRVFLAENATVMARVLALELVAGTPPEAFATPEACEDTRRALLEERWVDAVLAWMRATGEVVDVYEGYVPVWTDAELDDTTTSFEVRCGALFSEQTTTAETGRRRRLGHGSNR